ncbi:MAG: CsbD family protein [Actinomycetota bacterium]|nr:CsbD family protein [Actinomycetota bacterium]
MDGFEEVKGKVKQAAGDMAESPELRQEGLAQEEKAESAEKADDARAEARGQEARAREAELAQEAAQEDK